MTREQLKPCPFCGTFLVGYETRDGERFHMHGDSVNCPIGQLRLSPDVIAAWNTRVSPPSDETLRGALEEARESAETLIDLREQGMMAERKSEYGSRFNNEQEAAIRVMHYHIKQGAKIMYDALLAKAALTRTAEPREDVVERQAM